MVSAERHIAAMDKIQSLVSVRERNCSELRQRLSRAGFDAEETADALDSAVACGLVSEERYTRAYIRGKTHMGWGRSKILARLHHEGIDDETISLCEDEFADGEEELARAIRELEKHPSRSANPYVSMKRRLVNRGYSFDTAEQAVRAYMSKQIGN